MTTEFKSWGELTKLEQAQSTYWEIYKDAYGVRPRGVDTSSWTLADFEAEFQLLGEIIKQEDVARKEAQARAVVEFEDRVTNLMHTGTSRERVITWLMDAESANEDFEYFCYTQGLPYQYFRKVA
jgi:hypothetical protein